MTQTETVEERVAKNYAGLSGQLRKAADYVLTHPLDFTSRSLRAISLESDVSPATYSRLSKALGYQSFEEMKDMSRHALGRQVVSFSQKAEQLRRHQSSNSSMLERQSQACVKNIENFVSVTEEAKLERAAEMLKDADQVLVLGALASTGLVEYMTYLAQYFSSNWTLAGRMGASLGAQIATLQSKSVLMIVTKSPYAKRAIRAAELAKQKGADVIVITDSHKCPSLTYATIALVVPTDSPQFFSSYAVTLVLIETLIAMVVATSEADSTATIQEVEAKNQQLGEYWSE